MSRIASIGLVQIGTEPFEVERNRAATLENARIAFDRGAEIVVLPEMVIPGYVADARRLASIAEDVHGLSVEAWSILAAEYDGYICGGFCERDGEALYNSAVLVGPEGCILHYRKLHPFGDEKLTFTPGDVGLPVVHTRFGVLGVCVCYDLRFVEVVRALALKGASLILVPTAWVAGFDEQKRDDKGMCPQAYGALFQSNLNQVFIACASQAGHHGTLDFLGSSIIADPYGRLSCGPLPGDADEVAVARIEMSDAERAQVRSPLIAPRDDRRTDVYGIAIDGQVL